MFRSHNLKTCRHERTQQTFGEYYRRGSTLMQMHWVRCLQCKSKWSCDIPVKPGGRQQLMSRNAPYTLR